MPARKIMVAFPMSMPEGTGAIEAQRFVQEALMRMKKDMSKTITNAAEQEIFDQIHLPMMEQIQIKKRG